VALAFPIVVLALCPSCDLYQCDAGQTDRDTACDQVSQEADKKSAACKVARDTIGVLCTANCVGSSKDGKYCRSNDEVTTCIQAIDDLGCHQFTRASIEALESCQTLFNRLHSDCVEASSSSSSHHHDDDWD
jgi:hypothetical protein